MEPIEKITLTNMCMVYDNEGRILVEEKVGRDYKAIVCPGGHVEYHESFTDAVIREIYEETGLTISNVEMCGIKDWIRSDGSRYVVLLYRTNSFTGELKSSSEGRVFWMSREEISKIDYIWNFDMMLKVMMEDTFTEVFYDENTFPEGSEPIIK